MTNTVTYRLIDKKYLGSWSFKDGAAMRNGNLESTHYRPGTTSIFDIDNKDTNVAPQWVTFTHNESEDDPACEIIVPKANQLLINFLESHAFYNTVYKKHDPEEVYRLKEENYDQIQKALELITDSDQMKTKATAISLFGLNYFNATTTKCAADLKEQAIKNPSMIINQFNDERHESKFIVSLAYCNGIIRTNETATAIVWSDGGGKIISVAPGENPIDKLSNFIFTESKEAKTLLQEIGARMDNKEIVIKDNHDPEKEALKRELAELKAQLIIKQEEEGAVDEELKRVTEAFVQKFNKTVPVNKKNDLEWIKLKLQEE